jgi:hypothetical protein
VSFVVEKLPYKFINITVSLKPCYKQTIRCTIFQLCHGCQLYWGRKPEYHEKTTDLSRVTDTLTAQVVVNPTTIRLRRQTDHSDIWIMDWLGTVTTYYHDLSVTKLFPLIIVCVILLLSVIYPGADPGFQVGGGPHRKIAPSGGRRENFWGISCEKSRFYPQKLYCFQLRREARKSLGYFVWKITILRQKKSYFPQF